MRILIPLDGSPLAEYALGPVSTIVHASPETPHVDVVRVIRPPIQTLYPVYSDILGLVVEATDDYLRSIADRDSLQPAQVTTHTLMTAESCAAAILAKATALGDDLILMASHGRSGIAKLLLGSVAREILQCSAIPVFLFQPLATTFAPPSSRPFRMLVPLDGTRRAEAILPIAQTVVKALHGTIALLRVLPMLSMQSTVDRDRIISARDYLTQWQQHLEQQGIPAAIHVAFGDPAQQIILQLLRPAEPCDLIALAARSQLEIEQLFDGSTSSALFSQIRVPLLFWRVPAHVQEPATHAAT